MEQNQPMLAKKVWSMVRVAYLMLRKGISKRKLLLDLNMMVKRGKVAGSKALQNLMSHHHHHQQKGASHDSINDQHDDECEFSCTTSPTTNNHHHAFSLFPTFHKNHPYSNNKREEEEEEDLDMRAINTAVLKALEMIQSETSSSSSPSLPAGLGKSHSPMVRPLRVTDSPFPLGSVADHDEDIHVVDEAAEKFINRFYNDLRRQNSNASSSFGSS